VVWLIDLTDEKTNKKIEGTIFQNENVGLALKRFHCFKVNVRSLPEGELKDKYLRSLGFYFFDPAAQPTQRPLVGRRSESLSSFSSSVETVWNLSFTTALKKYQGDMKDVLDLLDKAEGKKAITDKKKEKLKDKPNARLQREVEKEEAEIAEQMKEAEDLEKEVIAGCTLRPEFLPEAPADETGKKD